MGNNPVERQRLFEQREAQADKNHHDFMRGLRGIDVPTVHGQEGLRISRGSRLSSGSPVSNSDVVVPGNLPDTDGSLLHPIRGRRRRSEPRVPGVDKWKPWLPGVDEWVKNVPKHVFWKLALVGAICGFGFGLSAGGVSYGIGYALLGGFAGLLLINILAQAFKVVVGALLVAAVALVLYVLFRASTGH